MTGQLKDIGLWDWEYLNTLPSGEFDWIDYKASKWLTLDSANLAALSEYLSAFANYDGGYLVVGMAQNERRAFVPDEGVEVRHPRFHDLKEWLEDKLPGLVDPPLAKLNVAAIVKPDNEQRCVLVVHVPESERAPHQGRNERFYSRRGSKLRALATREIFDIRGRKKHPDLSAEVAIFLRDERLEEKSRLNLYIRNNGRNLCQHYGGRLLVPVTFKNWFLSFNDVGAYVEDEDADGLAWSVSISSHGSPSFPASKRIHKIDFEGRHGARTGMEGKSSDLVKLTLFADEAEKKEFSWKAEDVIKTRQR